MSGSSGSRQTRETRVSPIWQGQKLAGTVANREEGVDSETTIETNTDTNTNNKPSTPDFHERLSPRDWDILGTLRTHRLASTDQLRRLHFTDTFGSKAAATRATQRVLLRLEGHRLIARLQRRIGGHRRGSAGTVWQLTSLSDRLLGLQSGETRPRRYIEPSPAFARHTLGVTELAVQLRETARASHLDIIELQSEPASWRHFVGVGGAREILKPDLFVVKASGEYEDVWALEYDLATEHAPAVVRKAGIYERYAATGAEQAAHGVFPAVLWIVPNTARRVGLERALAKARGITTHIHRVITVDQFASTVLAGGEPATNDNPEGRNP